MPRKKVEIPVDAAIPPSPLGALPAIVCPACKSRISCDGKTLHEKSSYLDELIETDAGVDEVEKKIEKMQKAVAAHEATIADLKSQLEAASKKPPQPEKEKPRVVQIEKPKSGSGKRSWWD